jgi:hypothetical protein
MAPKPKPSRLSMLLSVLVGLIALLVPAIAASGTPQACDPFQTEPHFMGQVRTSQEVLGFELGSQEVTTDQSNTYLAAVDQDSDRVVSGQLATSWQGRPLDYGIVGTPDHVTPEGLAAIRADIATLRDPNTTDEEAAALAASTPAILWVAANVHGNEESGTDAALRVLYELADRDDCAATQILDDALVVILPIQNPDGREADTRRNAYGFDMNRDWFARTQPETDGKVELLRQYPGVLFVDDHEMGTQHFFFPPNADPVYHEITDQSIDWINNIYGANLQDEFDRQKIQYFNEHTYDLFYMGYGDTVPAEGFTSAGMTFEKYGGDPIATRTYEQYVAQWESVSQGAINKEQILFDWHEAAQTAVAEGQAGELEPNVVYNKGNHVQREVPTDPVRQYFIRNDDPNRAYEVQKLVRRLQRMDVQVYQLNAPLTVPDYREYGRPVEQTTLPAGTYWIPMDQAQKHWVQALLNEDTYVPFPYFYDVTAWSNPLLMNLSGGFSGQEVTPDATLVPPQDEPAWQSPPSTPAIALFQMSAGASSIESTGWLRYLMDQVWHVPYTDVTASAIARGALSDYDVLLVPNGNLQIAMQRLKEPGRRALIDWVNAGGRYVGWKGGTQLAARLGISTVVLQSSHVQAPGTMFRVVVDQSSPLADGVGSFDWAYYVDDDVMTPGLGSEAVYYPPASSGDFFVSGYAKRPDQLGGTAAVVDEPVGAGRSVVFSFEPNFRAFTEGTQRLLWNAIFGPNPGGPRGSEAGSSARAAAERAARAAVAALPLFVSPIRIDVRSTDADRVAGLIRRYSSRFVALRSRGSVEFLIANPRELTIEEHPWARLLAGDLRALRLRGSAFSVD